jgi:hypothetical protein
MPTDHLDDLRAQAQYARERYQLYKAKAYGQRPTSPARLRELQRTYEQAEARLRFAEAEEKRAPKADDSREGLADVADRPSSAPEDGPLS